MPPVVPPTPTVDDQFFWDGVREGKLRFQRCTACGTVRHPPAPMCGDCHSLAWDTTESSGRGTVYTWIQSHHPTKPDHNPRLVVLVELEEGIRFVANLGGIAADDVRNEGGGGGGGARRAAPAAGGGPPAVPPGGGGVRAPAPTTAIVGIGQTEFSKHSGRSELQLASEAIAAAIADAGLAPADIDGAVTFAMDVNDELAVIRTAGIPELRFTGRTRGGGGGACATVQLASAAVASGAADTVVVYRAFNERSGRRFGQPAVENNRSTVVPPGWNWYLPFGLDTPAKIYSLWYQRYMHRYGVTNVDFGLYPVVARKHASTNPAAWYYGQPLTLEEHQASRWIVEPILRKLDCCQESDGGVALVVTSDARARDLPHRPVTVAAATQSHRRDGDEMFDYYVGDRAGFPEAASLGRQMYEATGLSPDDIDVAMIYENFSPTVFLQLEAFGFCGPGEAADFIARGEIELGGKTPVNTNGGLLGEAYIHGVNNILEGVRQVRGTAANQVDGVEHVLVSAGRSGLILTGP